MAILRISLIFCFMALCSANSFLYSSQDDELIDLLYQNKVRLIVMRHGEALHNLSHLMVSTRSPGIYLTEKGKAQVEHSALQLSKEQIDRIYVSPLYRTMQTTQIVNHQLQLPYEKIIVDDRLREQFFGTYEGRTYEEYSAYFPSPDDVFVEAVPAGESGNALFCRTKELLLNIASCHSNQTILLVTHGYNCCHISKCLTGSYSDVPQQAEYKIYDFREEHLLQDHSLQSVQ